MSVLNGSAHVVLPGRHSMDRCSGYDPFVVLQAWVSHHRAAVGTKCHKLLCVLLCTCTAFPCRLSQLDHKDCLLHPKKCSIHSVAASLGVRTLAVGGSHPPVYQIFHIHHHNGSHPTFTPKQALVVSPAVDAQCGSLSAQQF